MRRSYCACGKRAAGCRCDLRSPGCPRHLREPSAGGCGAHASVAPPVEGRAYRPRDPSASPREHDGKRRCGDRDGTAACRRYPPRRGRSRRDRLGAEYRSRRMVRIARDPVLALHLSEVDLRQPPRGVGHCRDDLQLRTAVIFPCLKLPSEQSDLHFTCRSRDLT